MSELVDVARAGGSLSDAADARTRLLIDGFLHTDGPPPARFSWVVLGSHARRELHCASDQDSALFWETEQAAASSYAKDLANTVIDGLEEFGMRRCDGGYMADTWSYSVADWVGIFRDRINAPNLLRNIAPTRGRATLVLTKGPDHRMRRMRLRKL